MTDESRETPERRRLAARLDSHGADVTRWPPEDRRLWAAAGADGDLQRRKAEAEAVDALLALVAEPRLPPGREAAMAALADRIVARATATEAPANVVQFPERRPAPSAPTEKRRAQPELWRAVALLAASLLCGVYIGAQGLGDDLLNDAGERLGVGTLVEAAPLDLRDTTATIEDVL